MAALTSTWLDSRLSYWAYLYLLRVPLLVWLSLIALAPLSVGPSAPFGPLLRGLFDIAPPVTSESAVCTFVRVTIAFGLVTLQALMAATAVAVIARLIGLSGAARFEAAPIANTPGFKLLVRVLPLLGAVSIVFGGAWVQSWPTFDPRVARALGMLVGTIAGVAAFWWLATSAQDFLWAGLQLRRHGGRTDWRSRLVRGVVGGARRLADLSPGGYVDPAAPQVWDRHVFALFQMAFSAAVYVLLLLGKLVPTGDVPWVPPLCLVLTLLVLLCWTLGSLTFFLDRFRLPVLLILAATLWLLGLSARADSFYHTTKSEDRAAWLPTNCPYDQLVRARANRPVVVVAATGGGIQAAAWTARVMTGLHLATQQSDARFDESVRVISSVSGGSVGALFVLDRYRNGSLPDEPAGLDTAAPVVRAEASSLDQAAWGLVYTDLVWSILPMFRLNDRLLTSDRGSALESAWRSRLSTDPLPLSAWRADAVAGQRPAVIFNSTLVESGQRLLVSTTDLAPLDGAREPPCRPVARDQASVGRGEFRTLYPGRSIDASTAARLSATFPYVSPATRIIQTNVQTPELHAVDGGYGDNFGMASLVEWLESALASAPDPATLPRILIVEIRASAVGGIAKPDGSRGLLFQLTHPLKALLAVWGNGQLSRNELEARLIQQVGELKRTVAEAARSAPDAALERLRTRGSASIQRVIFEFPAHDGRGVPIRRPLSWHLTPEDKRQLQVAWGKASIRECVEAVRHLLEGRNWNKTGEDPACRG
jgi:hypothetical protein